MTDLVTYDLETGPADAERADRADPRHNPWRREALLARHERGRAVADWRSLHISNDVGANDRANIESDLVRIARAYADWNLRIAIGAIGMAGALILHMLGAF